MTPETSFSASAAPSPSHTPECDAPAPSAPDGDGQGGRGPSRFARLIVLAGPGFMPVGLLARIPLAMLTVGTLTLVTSVSGSHAAGGAAAAAVGIGSALGAPALGALADRNGQRPVLLLSAALHSAAVVALIVVACAPGLPGAYPAAVLSAAFASGITCPQVGPLARVRWMGLAAQGPTARARQDLDTAMSYESTADEVTFVLGPALVGILASLVAPWLPLALAAAMTAALVPAFAVHRSHLAVPAGLGRVPGETAVRMPAAVALPVLAMVCMGTFFGSIQSALSAFSAGYGGSEAAGLLYAAVGASSALAALSVAYWPRSLSLASRWLLCATAMALLATLLLVPSSTGAMVAVLLVLGLPVGPAMVTVFAVGGTFAPAARLGTAMTALASGIVAGSALGSALGGQLAQAHGSVAAFLVPVFAALGLAALGAAVAVVSRR